MTVMAFVAFIGGLRRVAAAPALLLGAWGVTLAVLLAMQLVPGGVRAVYLQPAAAAGALAGIPQTFGPGLVGFQAVLSTLGDLYAGWPLGAANGIAAAGVVVWTFLAGGILDRLARQQRTEGSAFLAACRHHFWPLARLAALAGAVYWILFGGLYSWLLDDPSGAPLRLPTVSADAGPLRSALQVTFGAGVAGVGLLFDYARVRAVVEDRRSMVGALLAALRFVRRRPAAVAGLWLMNAVLTAAALAVWSLAASGAVGQAMRGAFVGAQLCIAVHLFAQLVAWASQTAYFQDQLAHATYVARARVPRSEPERPQ